MGWFYLPPTRVGGRGFVLQQYELEFPSPGYSGIPSVDLDEAWLAGSELVILEMVPAGVIGRTVTIEGFRMGS